MYVYSLRYYDQYFVCISLLFVVHNRILRSYLNKRDLKLLTLGIVPDSFTNTCQSSLSIKQNCTRNLLLHKEKHMSFHISNLPMSLTFKGTEISGVKLL